MPTKAVSTFGNMKASLSNPPVHLKRTRGRQMVEDAVNNSARGLTSSPKDYAKQNVARLARATVDNELAASQVTLQKGLRAEAEKMELVNASPFEFLAHVCRAPPTCVRPNPTKHMRACADPPVVAPAGQ